MSGPYKVDDNEAEANWIHRIAAARRKTDKSLVLKFSPDEARDDHGRWTGGGGAQDFSPEGGQSTARSKGTDFTYGQWGDWQQKLTESEHQALRTYESVSYQAMNGLLRNTYEAKMLSADDKAKYGSQVEALKGAIAKAPPLKTPLIVYRGMASKHIGDLKEGDTYEDKGFVSTTIARDQAGAYDVHGRQAMARIVLPKGFKAGLAEDWMEVILPPGSRFRVRSVEHGADGDHLDLEALNG